MYLSVLQVDIIHFFSDHGTYAYNVGETIINHPPVITMFIAGIDRSQMGGAVLPTLPLTLWWTNIAMENGHL